MIHSCVADQSYFATRFAASHSNQCWVSCRWCCYPIDKTYPNRPSILKTLYLFVFQFVLESSCCLAIVTICIIFQYYLFSIQSLFGVLFLSCLLYLPLFRRPAVQQPWGPWRPRFWATSNRGKRQVSLIILNSCSFFLFIHLHAFNLMPLLVPSVSTLVALVMLSLGRFAQPCCLESGPVVRIFWGRWTSPMCYCWLSNEESLRWVCIVAG